MQVGAFFEIYGIKNPITEEITGSLIQELSDICQLNISEKKVTLGTQDKHIIMAGFRDFTIDKYLLKLTDAGYTIPVFIQEKMGNKVTRKLDRIYSVGTYMSCETDSSPNISNNVMCVWVDTFKPFARTLNTTRDTIVVGVAVINIFTGKTYIFQYETTYYLNITTFDELERCVSIYSPCEVLFITPFSEKDTRTIIQFGGIKTSTHLYKNTDEKIVNCSNQKYIKQILSNFFGEETYDICSEFQNRIMATQAYCFLLNFVKEQNPDLVRKISLPVFNNTSDRMILANHTLSQLNIIDDTVTDSKQHGKMSSVLSFMNKCCSPMGRRRFQFQLTNPTFNEEWLNNEYDITEIFLDGINAEQMTLLRKRLSKIRDIEKLCRQLILRKIYPSSIFQLYESLGELVEINLIVREHYKIRNYLCRNDPNQVFQIAVSILEFLGKHFDMDSCKTTASMTTFDENIIARGISAKLDEIVDKYEESQEIFRDIRNYFNELMQKYEKADGSGTTAEYVKIHETDKSGVSLQITSRRSQNLKAYLDKYEKEDTVKISENVSFSKKDIRFVKSSGANVDIQFSLLDETCRNMLAFRENIQSISVEVYLEILTRLENLFLGDLEMLSEYISKLDVLQCKAYIAKTYNYCRPVIDPTAEKSFVDVTDLRHCLIENIQQNEIYVTNDLCLGSQRQDGVLLYGTNAVGKTSFIRALGISVILAQAGLYVPCSKFAYKPYTAIFSRILGNDNLFKGLSTFAVEMSELRLILKMADEKSLILGDELCSGTEMESALSIFVSGLMKLHENKSSFIFATHFHEVVDYDEIRELGNLKMKHMAVRYDREKDCLIYDRKLRDGSGPRIYGLEVCKSLYLDEDFLKTAYSIRNKYFPETRGELSFGVATYNAKKIKGMCEMCGENAGEEIHHLQQQKEANEDGFIGSFHKNHAANLMTVCEKCHDTIHSATATAKHTRKKTTAGYTIM